MAEAMEKPAQATGRHEEEEEEDEQSFEELGLDPRLTRALIKKGIHKPTPIQRVAIPLILVSQSNKFIVSIVWSPRKLRVGKFK